MTKPRPTLRAPRDPNQCLRLNETAALCGVRPRTIKSWVSKGTFPRPIKPTQTLSLWVWADVRDWLDGHKARRP